MRGRQPIVGAVLAAITMVLGALGELRGLNLWSLWLIESTERFSAWRAEGTDQALQAAFSDGNGILYAGPWLASVLGGGDALLGTRLAAVLAAGVVAWLVFVWGTRMSGARAGAAAVALLWCVPRFWAAVTVASPSIFVLAGVLLVWRVMLLTRDDGRWFGPAALMGGVALASGLPAWLTLLPLAWLVLVRPGSLREGLVGIRNTSVFALALPLAFVGVFVALSPWLHSDTVDRVVAMLGVWVERPAEPFLVGGVRWGQARMWPWTPLLLLVVTTPAPIWLTALGLPLLRLPFFRPQATPPATASGGWNDADTRQEWVVFALWSIILPLLLRSVYHGGADLMLCLVVACVLAAATVIDAAARGLMEHFGLAPGAAGPGAAGSGAAGAGASPTGRGQGASLALSLAVLVPVVALSAADIARCGGAWEAYRSGIVGGAQGATVRGYSRYPHGPVPLAPFRAAADVGVRRYAILVNAWEVRPVMQRYFALGLLPEDSALVPLGDAQAVVLSFDDTLPELYEVVSDWRRLASSSPERVLTVDVDGVTVFAIGRLFL